MKRRFSRVDLPAWFVNKFNGEVRAGSPAFNLEFFYSEELEGMNPYGEASALFLNRNPSEVGGDS